MPENELTYFEKRLVEEIARIEKRMRELGDEKRALQRQLTKARAEQTGLQDSTRKNSLNRVLAENAVLKALHAEGKPMRTKQLLQEARLTNFELKETTFRTHLYRMKKKGLIKSGRSTGSWELPNRPV